MFHSAQTDNGENHVNVIAQLATGLVHILKRSAPSRERGKVGSRLKDVLGFHLGFLRMRQRESEAKAQHHSKETKKNEREKSKCNVVPVVRQMVHFLPGTNKRRKFQRGQRGRGGRRNRFAGNLVST